MKYIVMDWRKSDLFTEEFDNAEQAIKEAQKQWDYLTKHDQKTREAFYVLESDNPDEDAENHFDGTPIKKWK